MKILISANEAYARCNWLSFCEITGLQEYCVNEGMDGDREFELTEQQAKQLGLIE